MLTGETELRMPTLGVRIAGSLSRRRGADHLIDHMGELFPLFGIIGDESDAHAHGRSISTAFNYSVDKLVRSAVFLFRPK